MPAVGSPAVGTTPLAGGGLRSIPVVTITGPDSVIDGSTFTTTWTYLSATSRPQLFYRVRVKSVAGDTLYDSLAVSSAGTSLAVPYTFSSGTYTLCVSASDGTDWSAEAEKTVTLSVGTITDIAPNTEVGSVFEIAINGQGFMLADTPERKVRRQAATLQAPRFATGDTPFDEAVDRYTFTGRSDWSGGAGQGLLDRPRSSGDRYLSSHGIDPFDLDGGIRLLPDVTETYTSTADVWSVVADGTLWMTDADGELRSQAPGGSVVAGADWVKTPIGMTSDGERPYVLFSDGEVQRYSGAWAAWGTGVLGATDIAWCADRIAIAYVSASNGFISTYAPDGTKDGTLDANFGNGRVKGMAAGDGYLWFGVNRGEQGYVYAWQLGASNGTEFLAMNLPEGETSVAFGFYLGNVIVVSTKPSTSGATMQLYRAAPSSGELTPELVTTVDCAADLEASVVGNGRLVIVSFQGGGSSGESGTLALDLSTGGWSSWLMAADAADTGVVRSLFVFDGKLGFTVDGAGVFVEDPTSRVSSGTIVSSVSDEGSSLSKVYSEWLLGTGPMPAGSSVQLEFSSDEGTNYETIATVSGGGTTTSAWPISAEGVSMQTRVTLNDGTAAGPVVRASQVKLHPLTLVDRVLELPINVNPGATGLNGRAFETAQDPMTLIRFLESLIGDRVLFQDVDWPSTATAEVWELVSIDAESVGFFDRAAGQRSETQAVATVTLRRAAG